MPSMECQAHRPHGGLLHVDLTPVPDPPPILDSERVVMCPVHETAEVIPFVHAAKGDPVADGDRNAFCKVNVVRHQHSLPVAQLQDKALMA